VFSIAKQLDRLLRDAAASRLELRQVRSNFAAVLEEQQYKRREAERNLIEAAHRVRALLPPQEAVELDWPRSGHEAAVQRARQFLADLDSA
jgi:hypothetical protein